MNVPSAEAAERMWALGIMGIAMGNHGRSWGCASNHSTDCLKFLQICLMCRPFERDLFDFLGNYGISEVLCNFELILCRVGVCVAHFVCGVRFFRVNNVMG